MVEEQEGFSSSDVRNILLVFITSVVKAKTAGNLAEGSGTKLIEPLKYEAFACSLQFYLGHTCSLLVAVPSSYDLGPN